MNVDNAVFVQSPQMHSLFCQTRKFAHLDVSASNQINVLQRASAQLKQFQGQRVFLRLPFLCHIPQRFHGLQKAINGAFRHHDALRQFGNTNFALFTQRLQDAKNLQHGRYRIGLFIQICDSHLSPHYECFIKIRTGFYYNFTQCPSQSIFAYLVTNLRHNA